MRLQIHQINRTNSALRTALICCLVAFAVLVPTKSANANTDAVANAIQTTLYEAEITRLAAERQWNERFQRHRDRIEELSLQVALAEDAQGDALLAADALRDELRRVQQAFTNDLAAQNRAYQEELAIFRDSLQAITATPEGLEALELYNEGDRQRARAILRDLRDARDRARQMRASIESASELRSIAALELDMRLRGELLTAEVLATYEEITRLDPGIHWDWVELTRLYRDAGDLNGALEAAGRAASTAEGERDRSVAFNELGDVQVAQGDLPAALASYQAGLNITQALAARDPGNTGRLRDLSVWYDRIGDVQRAQGDLPAALASYQAGLNIAQALAARDSGNTGWQRDLSVSYERIGDVQVAQGDLPAALASYQAGLNIAQALAARDPGNTGWQRDLIVSHFNLAQARRLIGNLDEARDHLRKASAINQRLTSLDRTNAVWANDRRVIESFLRTLDGG